DIIHALYVKAKFDHGEKEIPGNNTWKSGNEVKEVGKIIWSPSALKDIESIAEYISRDSADQASLFVLY
ncbi:MAG: type II toxin-antitoxin system RelE/ParE family toxin, partial [Elusimicrobia bacterium]|nr:type II toxin-antitoxin system RelE/ParE family toxin [Elusimicrobiota bacterium]